MNASWRWGAAVAALSIGFACATSGAEAAQDDKRQNKPSDNYDELFGRYLAAARAAISRPDQAPDAGWMSGLTADLRARNRNDLVTIRVVESIIATGTADSALDKSGSGSASVSSLFGLESKLPGWLDPTNLAGTSSNTDFKGGGATRRSGEIAAILTARVADVLANGDLLVEGVREIDINGDRQIVVLTGVVRPSDIAPDNVVLSTSVGQLRIRYFGRGLIKDNLRPGWLIRVLNKIF